MVGKPGFCSRQRLYAADIYLRVKPRHHAVGDAAFDYSLFTLPAVGGAAQAYAFGADVDVDKAVAETRCSFYAGEHIAFGHDGCFCHHHVRFAQLAVFQPFEFGGSHQGYECFCEQVVGLCGAQQRYVAVVQRACEFVVVVAAEYYLQCKSCDYGFEACLLFLGFGQRQRVDVAAGLADVYLELFHECRSERFAVPVFEFAAEDAFENAVQIAAHFLGIYPEDKH